MECAHLDENVLIAVAAANQQQTISPICSGWLTVYSAGVTFVRSRVLYYLQSLYVPHLFDFKLSK